MNPMLITMGKQAKISAMTLSYTLSSVKNAALMAIAQALEDNVAHILAENEKDLAKADENGITNAMQDRLRLTGERISDIARSVRYIASLEDPVGRVIGGNIRPNGLQIVKRTVPLGVVGIIFESRPNVTVDCATLCLKSGNACILRGGKEAIHSNTVLVEIIRATLVASGIAPDSVQLITDTSRETALELMKLNEYVDVLIPRGGKGLIRSVVENAGVPVIETGAGNCHIFLDETADLQTAVSIVDNAKTSRPSVCNALETLLVHKRCAERLLPPIARCLRASHVVLRGCEKTRTVIDDGVVPATEEDWAEEYDDYILAIKVVDGLDEALAHIDRYSTHHSESILTNDAGNAKRFCDEVDSTAVYVNASTRFTDGGEFGLGAEIGISTQKLHARGPMGLAELVSYKYIITGNGQIR